MPHYEVPLEWYVLLACTLLAISVDFLFRDAPAHTRKRIGRVTVLLTLLLAVRVAVSVAPDQPTAVPPPATSSAPPTVASSPEPSPSPTSAPPQPTPSGQPSPGKSAALVTPGAPGVAALPQCPLPPYGGIVEEASEYTGRQLTSIVSPPIAGCVKAIEHWAQYAPVPHLQKPCYLWFTRRSVTLPAGSYGTVWQIPQSDIEWFTSKFKAHGDNLRCTVVTLS